jgi:hypothetical protein
MLGYTNAEKETLNLRKRLQANQFVLSGEKKTIDRR